MLVHALPATIALAVGGVGVRDLLRRVLVPMDTQLLPSGHVDPLWDLIMKKKILKLNRIKKIY